MIPIHAYAGRRVGVLGLGRSGLATARALKAGGAEPVCWDDDAAARETAALEGLEMADLTRQREAAPLACLVVSPGIPQLCPAPHPAVLWSRSSRLALYMLRVLRSAEFLAPPAAHAPEPRIARVPRPRLRFQGGRQIGQDSINVGAHSDAPAKNALAKALRAELHGGDSQE